MDDHIYFLSRRVNPDGLEYTQVFEINLLNVVEDLDGEGKEDHYDLDDDGDGFSDEDEIVAD